MAVLLPMSIVWVFVACVCICASESAEENAKTQVCAPLEIRDISDCEGCPLTSLPKATIPERTIHSDLYAPILVQCPMISVYSFADGVGPVLRQRQHSAADPPLFRLPALRI